MDYDRARVRERIQYIEASLERLEILRRLPKGEFLADFRNIESAKHLLQTAIEAMLGRSQQHFEEGGIRCATFC